MRRLIALAMLAALAAPAPGADPSRARPAAGPAPLSADVRDVIRAMLKDAAPTARPEFRRAAMTFEQARHYADVPPKLTWQGEYDDWFVFGFPDRDGGPDIWHVAVFVRKGSNVVVRFRPHW